MGNSTPERLYKYTAARFAEGLITRGAVRIGTLYEYRDIEKYKGNVGDEGEGVFEEIVNHLHSDGQSFSEADPAVQRAVKRVVSNPQSINWFGMIGCQVRVQHPNCFVYCTTLSCRAEMYADFGNTCVEIRDPERFGQALGKALARHLRCDLACLCAPCVYDRKPVIPSFAHLPRERLAFLYKPERMRVDQEFRFSYHPTARPSGALAPQILEVPEITKLCRILPSEEHEQLAGAKP